MSRMYNIWMYSSSEDEWYNKMIALINKYDDFNSNELWRVALSYVYAAFCAKTCDEAMLSMDSLLYQCEMSYEECIDKLGIGVTLEMIRDYMSDKELETLNNEAFSDLLSYYEDELNEQVLEKCHELVDTFWEIVSSEFKSKYEVVLFFYIREEHYQEVKKFNPPDASFEWFVEDRDELDEEYVAVEEDEEDEDDMFDDEEDVEDQPIWVENQDDEDTLSENRVKTKLYSFLNNYDATSMASVMTVYEWVDRRTTIKG